jgi:hypothetical protein
MIVAETDDGLQLVTQPDHARLAGQFADHWGGAVERATPDAAVRIAAHEHDAGWHSYDMAPRLDGGDSPVDFREMDPETWVSLYEDGIDAVAELDAYAGLLVSLHGAGLRRQRYGLSPSWPETPTAFEPFVDREEARQSRLLADLLAADRPEVSPADERLIACLHESQSVPDGYDGRLWPDYRRLQAWDTLSLAFCVTDAPPGYAAVGDVPTTGRDDPESGAEADATLSLAAVGPGEFTVDPYPFDADPLTAWLPVRTVGRQAFDDERALREAYYETPVETRTLTLRSPA